MAYVAGRGGKLSEKKAATIGFPGADRAYNTQGLDSSSSLGNRATDGYYVTII